MKEENFNKIKKLMRIIGGKAIIVEDGKPSFIIADVDAFLDIDDSKKSENPEVALIEKINQDILVWRNKQSDKELFQMEKNLTDKRDLD